MTPMQKLKMILNSKPFNRVIGLIFLWFSFNVLLTPIRLLFKLPALPYLYLSDLYWYCFHKIYSLCGDMMTDALLLLEKENEKESEKQEDFLP